jgi:putative FmdB family regulatory protein
MPLYEYECDACGHRFEKIQKYSDPLEDTCPKCGGVVHKMMSSPAIQFKGSGFYITDYAKKDHQDAAKADSAQGAKAEKAEPSEKSERSEQAEKSGKSERSEKAEKAEKPGKADTSEKIEKSEKKASAPAKTETSTPAKSG